MIDIHIHMLPGMDDGAGDLDEALEMCRMCAEDGVGTVIATPHDLNGVYSNDREKVLGRISELAEAVKAEGIPVEVLPGADIAMSPELPERLDDGSVMTLNDTGKYILLEPPAFFIADALKRQVFEIKRRDITPVITHPERNATLMTHKDALYDAVLGGALVQVTAASLTGSFGPTVQNHCIELLRRKIAHVIASDSHDTRSRKPGLSKALETAIRHVGEENARMMVYDRPEAILRGEEFEAPEPLRADKKQGFFSMFLRQERSS